LIQTYVYSQQFGNSGPAIWLVPALGQGAIVVSNAQNLGSPPVADSHGIWFAGGGQGGGSWLLVIGRGIFQMTSIGGSIAGACQ
jgi:hypothetical protein